MAIVASPAKKQGMSVRAVFSIRDFRLLWFSQIISEFGDSLTNLALLILINRLTGSTAAIAGMTIVILVPQITFGLLAGVYVDRLDRKQIMIVSDLVRGLLVLGFVLVNSAEQVWILYIIGFLQASVGTFFLPAQNALLPLIVPKEGLMAANSLTQTSRVMCITLGSATAGLITGIFGVVWPAFAIDALTFFVAVGLVFSVKMPQRTFIPEKKGGVRAIFQQLTAGISIIFKTPPVLGTMLAAAVSLLGLGAVNILFVPMITRELKSSESWLGAIQIAATIGMILSGSTVAVLAARLKPTVLVSVGLLIFGATIGLIGLSGSVWQMVIIQFVAGCTIPAINASIATINQMAIKDEVRGRVMSARLTIASVANLLSMAFAGVFGDLIGIRTVFFVAAGLVVVAGLASGLVFRQNKLEQAIH